MPKKQNEQPVNEIRDPSTVPKYLRRRGVNVPAVERKERKPREPKSLLADKISNKGSNKVAEQQKIEVAMAIINDELKKAPDPVAEKAPEPVAEPATPAKQKRQRKETVPKTKTMRGPNKWQIHVNDFRAKNPGMSYKVAMVEAKNSYR